jgi:transcriptional regulator with XRE-family HTH domain
MSTIKISLTHIFCNELIILAIYRENNGLISKKGGCMLIFMEDKIELFVHGLKKWSKTKPHKKTQGELAAAIGKKQPTVSDYFSFKYSPEPKDIELWVKAFDLDEEEIIEIGRFEKRRAEGIVNQGISFNDLQEQVLKIVKDHSNIIPLDTQHWKVISKFQQKETALQINQALVELEEIDPEQLDDMLEIVLDRLDRKKREAAKKRDTGNDKWE